MNIISRPARTVNVAQEVIALDPNWAVTFGINDQPTTQTVRVNIPGKAAVAADPSATPPVAAAPACQPFNFVLWSAATSTTYAQAQALNNNAGYTQQQLVAAITAYLTSITAA